MLVFETELHRVESVAFSPCGRFIAAGGLGIELWDVGLERAWRWGWDRQGGHRNQYVRKVAFHPAGEWLFGSIPGYELFQVRAQDGESIVFPTLFPQAIGGERPNPHSTFDLSPIDGRIGVGHHSGCGCWARPISLAATEKAIWLNRVAGTDASELVFLCDGRLLTHAHRPWNVPPRFRVLSDSVGTELQVVPSGIQRIERLRASHDGRFLAAARDDTVRVWSVAHLHRPPRVLTNDSKKQITDFAFHPGGRHLATVSNDRGVIFWDTETWRPTKSFDWHEGRMRSLAFSPDGLVAAAGSDTGHVVLFDVEL